MRVSSYFKIAGPSKNQIFVYKQEEYKEKQEAYDKEHPQEVAARLAAEKQDEIDKAKEALEQKKQEAYDKLVRDNQNLIDAYDANSSECGSSPEKTSEEQEKCNNMVKLEALLKQHGVCNANTDENSSPTWQACQLVAEERARRAAEEAQKKAEEAEWMAEQKASNDASDRARKQAEDEANRAAMKAR